MLTRNIVVIFCFLMSSIVYGAQQAHAPAQQKSAAAASEANKENVAPAMGSAVTNIAKRQLARAGYSTLLSQGIIPTHSCEKYQKDVLNLSPAQYLREARYIAQQTGVQLPNGKKHLQNNKEQIGKIRIVSQAVWNTALGTKEVVQVYQKCVLNKNGALIWIDVARGGQTI